MTYFKDLGKIISKSGGLFLLQECQVSFTSVNEWIKFLKHYLKLCISKPA